MPSVMSELEMDRNLSLFAMESPDDEQTLASAVQISSSIDSLIETLTLEETRVRVSEPSETHGFVTGDMVWGKVKSHPWWPGHVFSESFALPSVLRTKRENSVLIAFYGDSSYGWFDPTELIPYEPTFLEKSKQTTQRNFLNAVEDSVDEVSRRAALGISCRCRNPDNFRPAKVSNYFEVDVAGYEKNAIYSKSQVQEERKKFHPKGVVSFLQSLAVTARGSDTKDVEWYRNVATVLAWRSANFLELDEMFVQAFGQLLARGEQDDTFTSQVSAPLSGPLRIAETLDGEKKSSISKQSSSSSTAYKEKVKRNKYVLKRREEQHNATTAEFSNPPSLPDAYFAQKQPTIIVNDSNSDPLDLDGDYVLQKREKVEDVVRDISITESSAVNDEAKIDKRPVEGANELNINKKRREGEASRTRKNSNASHFDLGQLEIADVVSGLLELARDVFYGLGLDLPSIVRRVFLKFRSLVCSQGLFLRAATTTASSSGHVLPSRDKAKPTKLVESTDDQTNIIKNLNDSKSDPLALDSDYVPRKREKVEDVKCDISITESGADEGEVKMEKRPVEGVNESNINKKRREGEASWARRNSNTPHFDWGLLGQLEIPDVVSGLSELARGVFYDSERDLPLIVRHIFLRFRSLVYSQSLFLRAAAADSSRHVLPSHNEAKQTKLKLMEKSGDPPNVIKNLTDSNSDPLALDRDYVPRKREKVEDVKCDISNTGNGADDGDAKIKKRPVEDVNELSIKKKRKERQASWANSNGSYFDSGLSGQLEIPNVVSGLFELARDVFYGLEQDLPSIVRHVLLRFRSLVYSQNLSLRVAAATISSSSSSKHVLPSHDEAKPPKLKLTEKYDDPTNVIKKRAPSDRREERSAKRMKRLHQLKSMTQKTSHGEPKVNKNGTITATMELAKKPAEQEPVLPPPPKKETSYGGPKVNKNETMTPTMELAKKPEDQEPELPRPPKKESPTFLIMKFPPTAALPSIWNLNARFARFGPLKINSTHISWKLHSCRVKFKYNADALKALKFVKSNDIFGQAQVEYSIIEARPSKNESSSVVVPSPPDAPKSILKRACGDTEAGKESRRVKFNLAGSADSPPSADVAPPEAPPSKSISSPPNRCSEPCPPPTPPPGFQNADLKRAPPAGWDVDISHEMMSLLLRCHEIVSRLNALPGFAPYRAL